MKRSGRFNVRQILDRSSARARYNFSAVALCSWFMYCETIPVDVIHPFFQSIAITCAGKKHPALFSKVVTDAFPNQVGITPVIADCHLVDCRNFPTVRHSIDTERIVDLKLPLILCVVCERAEE